jgi:excinuclease ABC subunit C
MRAFPSTLLAQVRKVPRTPGVYWMKDKLGTILYVGKAKNLKNRVQTYFQAGRRRFLSQPKVEAMLDLVESIDWFEAGSEAEAILIEGQLIKKWRPRYNTDFTDDKNFLSVKVTLKDPLPKFLLVRQRIEDGSLYYGPFAHSQSLKKTLVQLRNRFGILLSDAHPQALEPGRYQLYDDIRGEIFGHPNFVTIAEYQERLKAACEYLQGKMKADIESLEAAMIEASEAQDYEKAAKIRDQWMALKESLNPPKPKTPNRVTDALEAAQLAALEEVLHARQPLHTIEGFDISHISGTFTVASMVHFEKGKAQPKQYRRFKILTSENDDYRSMAEVVLRRYRRILSEGKPLPDLILIDGGLGQVRAAQAALQAIKAEAPLLIGLAKREETIIFPDGEALKLPDHHLGLHLLQRVRDEAHRFANTFSAQLKGKTLNLK